MRVTVEMDDIRLGLAFERQKPVAGASDIVRRARHPFELPIALSQIHSGDRAGLLTLLIRWLWPYHCECELDPFGRGRGTERARELESVRPHASGSIGRHQ